MIIYLNLLFKDVLVNISRDIHVQLLEYMNTTLHLDVHAMSNFTVTCNSFLMHFDSKTNVCSLVFCSMCCLCAKLAATTGKCHSYSITNDNIRRIYQIWFRLRNIIHIKQSFHPNIHAFCMSSVSLLLSLCTKNVIKTRLTPCCIFFIM